MAVTLVMKDGTTPQIAAAASIAYPSYLGTAWIDLSSALPGVSGGTIVGSVELSTVEYVTYQN